jgi:hypothetical protein
VRHSVDIRFAVTVDVSGLRPVLERKPLPGARHSNCLLMIAASPSSLSGRRARFRTDHADFSTASGNASTLPRSAGGTHFETLRKLGGM